MFIFISQELSNLAILGKKILETFLTSQFGGGGEGGWAMKQIQRKCKQQKNSQKIEIKKLKQKMLP